MFNHLHGTTLASSPGTRRVPRYVWFEVGGEAEEAAKTVVGDVRDVWHVHGLPNLDPLLVAVLLLVIIVVNTHGAGAAHHQRLCSTTTTVPTSPPTPPPLPA